MEEAIDSLLAKQYENDYWKLEKTFSGRFQVKNDSY